MDIEVVEIERFDDISEWHLKIQGDFWVSGKDYENFKEKLEDLISEYRI